MFHGTCTVKAAGFPHFSFAKMMATVWQRLTIGQMAKSHEEQTAQMNQTIANLNETVEYLKKKLFASSSEKTKKDEFPGQMALFNEAEAVVAPSVLELPLKEAVSGYDHQPQKPKVSREKILAGFPVIEFPCTVPDEDRNCPYCNTPMEVVECPEGKKDRGSVIVEAETPSALLKHSLASTSTVVYVMYQKYVNSIPLYRQETDWKQLGVKLGWATLANWLIKCGMDYMEPVYKRPYEHLLERGVIHMDETRC